MTQNTQAHEGGPLTRGIRLPNDVIRALKVEAAKRDSTLRGLAEEAIRAYLKLPAKKTIA
ncbi:MAG: hypothetical protein WDO73_25235 [Ignavibacteriota bacterium]